MLVSGIKQNETVRHIHISVPHTQSCPTLCDPMDCSPPGYSVHGVFPARILDLVAISYSRAPSRPRDQTVSPALAGRFFITVPPGTPSNDSREFCYAKELLKNWKDQPEEIRIFIHSVQVSRSVVSDSLRPHELQHARPPCPPPTPRVHSKSRLSSR